MTKSVRRYTRQITQHAQVGYPKHVKVDSRHVISGCLAFGIFCTCVAYLLLAARSVALLARDYWARDLPFCLVMPALALLLPLCMGATPKHFK